MRLLLQKRNLLDVLKSQFNDKGELQGDEVNFFCPKHPHHKRKLAINLKTHLWHCWVCDIGGKSLRSLFDSLGFDESLLKQIDYGKNNYHEAEVDIVDLSSLTIKLPKEFKPLCYKRKNPYYVDAVNYLLKRQLSPLDILRNKIGYCDGGKYNGRIIVPSFDSKGNLNYFVSRSYYDRVKPKYKNPKSEKSEIIFNELNIDFKDEVILCEGVFDAFVCGYNSIPLLGSSIHDYLLKNLIDSPRIYLSLDPDTYETKMIKIIDRLKKYILGDIMFIDIRPFKDVGIMTKEEFNERKLKAQKVSDSLEFRIRFL